MEDCICAASECVNLLDKKCFCGHLAFKVDIRKAYYWMNYILATFRRFGFSEKSCAWIHFIFVPARVLVLFNGVLKGYFSCPRGVHRGI